MNLKLRKFVVTAVVAFTSPTVMAQSNHQGHNHANHAPSQATATATAGPHGGAVRQASGVQLETVITQAGIQMFVYDAAGQPVSVTQGRAQHRFVSRARQNAIGTIYFPMAKVA